MKRILIAIMGITLFFASCEWLEENTGLGEDEIVEGLKTALAVGADSSSTALSLVNGYYGDALVKIPLPEQAEQVRTLIDQSGLNSVINLDVQFEKVVKSINRAAEDAAKDAAPIFKDAITGLSISQGLEILNGQVPAGSVSVMKNSEFDSTAATQYLKGETFNPLTNLYAPKINTALDKDLGLGFSAVDAWSELTNLYNDLMSQWAVQLAVTAANVNLPSSLNDDLGEFSTQKALDGLFYKVGETEKKIRRDPWEWITTTVGDILTKVFG